MDAAARTVRWSGFEFRFPPLERNDKGSRTRLGLPYFCDPALGAEKRNFTFTFIAFVFSAGTRFKPHPFQSSEVVSFMDTMCTRDRSISPWRAFTFTLIFYYYLRWPFSDDLKYNQKLCRVKTVFDAISALFA